MIIHVTIDVTEPFQQMANAYGPGSALNMNIRGLQTSVVLEPKEKKYTIGLTATENCKGTIKAVQTGNPGFSKEVSFSMVAGEKSTISGDLP
jgi:hypothetical protein